MEYTLADAAKAARLNKSTLFRAIKGGRLSARRLEDGSYRVDASELARVYDLQHLTRGGTDALQQSAPADVAPATAVAPRALETELAVLRVRLEMAEAAWENERRSLEEQRDREREIADDFRKRLDRAEERILALEAPRPTEKPQEAPPAVSSSPESSRPPKGLLARLLGR